MKRIDLAFLLIILGLLAVTVFTSLTSSDAPPAVAAHHPVVARVE